MSKGLKFYEQMYGKTSFGALKFDKLLGVIYDIVGYLLYII